MPDVWMPSTEQVRDGYAIDPEDEYRDPINAPANRRANERYFDRWLAAHDREVAARTLDDMADEGERFMFGATGERMPSDMDAEGIQPRWHEIRRLRERAAALRSGTEGGDQPSG